MNRTEPGLFDLIRGFREDIRAVTVDVGEQRVMLARHDEILANLAPAITKLTAAVEAQTAAELRRSGEQSGRSGAFSLMWSLGRGAWLALAATGGALWANWREIHDFLAGGPKP